MRADAGRPARRQRGGGLCGSRRGLWLPIVALLIAASAPLAAQDLDEARRLHRAGELRAALEAYARVAAAGDPADAATASNNACVIRNDLGEYAAARDECERAAALRRGLGDEPRLARTLNNLAIAQQSLGDYESARQSLLEALEINTRRDDARARVLTLSNLGALATLAGGYGDALVFHRRAAELAQRHGDEPWAVEQLEVAAINRGVVLEHLGAYREALDLYRGLLAAPAVATASRRRAQLKLNSGVLYRNLGDPERAMREFEQVAAIFRRLEDPDGLANALLNQALALHLDLERWPQAEAAYREALELAGRHGSRPEEIRTLFYLGGFLLERGRPDEAEETFRRCLAAAEASGSAPGRWSALAGLGRIAASRGDHRLAVERLEAAIDQIEAIASGVGEAGLRSGYFGAKRPVYAAAAQARAELDRLEPGGGHGARALEIAQRAKARALLDRLGDAGWSAGPLPASELARPELGGLLVEYFAAERDLLRWTLNGSAVEMRNLGPHAPILAVALDAYRRLEAGSPPEPAALRELAGALLGGLPLEGAGGERLRVAPDAVLDRLPFEILPLPGPLAGDAVVAERFAVAYVPSASTLVWLRQRRGKRPALPADAAALVGFADPLIAGAGPALALLSERFALAPLPAAAAGLETLAGRVGGRRLLFTGAAATEAAFRAAAPEPARVVHVASHAVVDERPGRGAAVLLAPGDGHDGLLEPREIAALDQRAELTVLASCRSALESESGGALSALTGAFLAAGSSAVVATLWDVGDAATAAFMEQFYYQLGRGRAPVEALREAKRRLRRDPRWNQPHLWSGYVLVGEAPAVYARGGGFARSILAAALAAAAVALAGWWLASRRPRRRRRGRG